MTKTLTEQWREGTLDEGWYYVVSGLDDEIRMLYFEGDYFLDTDVPLDNNEIKKVLSAVPTYDEWQSHEKCADMLIDVNKKWEKTIKERKRLEKQLEIATKALEKYEEIETHDWIDSQVVALKALKEMEGVK